MSLKGEEIMRLKIIRIWNWAVSISHMFGAWRKQTKLKTKMIE